MAAERTRALLDWYREHRRDLPWRDTSDPWAILVSEVMSHQTQISRVVPAWSAFMERFPTPGDLARADRSELIRLWAGLGYQRRAINLHRAAQVIDATGWPTDVAGLTALPGVGPYTAAAVACFSWGEPVAAVDTNLRRVLSRWIGRGLSGRELTRVASELLDRDQPSAWNQAIMDLGAMRCRPRQPLCEQCPVEAWCRGPATYEPPRRQSPYEGSVRQARAATLRALADHGALTPDMLAIRSGFDRARLDAAITSLLSDGTVEQRGDTIAISDD